MTDNQSNATDRRLVQKRSRYFLTAAWLALAIAVVGFLKTFFLPTVQGTFTAPLVIYLHGAFLFLWVIMLVVQATLIRNKKIKFHRLIGFAMLGLVVCIVISTMATGVYVMKRDLSIGLDQIAISSLVGTFTAPIIFATMVIAAIIYRKRAETHKRLIFLATVAILWPAFFRFRHYFPTIPNPEFIFAFLLPYSMIVLAMVWEKLTVGRTSRVYLTVGLALIAENFLEYYFFDSYGWRIVANWLAGFFS